MFETRKDYIDILCQLQETIFPKLKKCWGNNVWFIMQIHIGFYFHYIFGGKIKLEKKKTSL